MILGSVNILELAGIIGIIIGLIGGLGAAYATFTSSATQGTITTLQQNNAALLQQNEIQATQIAALTGQLAAEQRHSATQDRQLADLRDLVQGTAAIADLTKKIDRFGDQLDESHSMLMGAILRGPK